MQSSNSENEKNKILKKTTAMNLWLRIFIGAFLVYLGYSLFIELGVETGKDVIILGGAAVVFAVFGIVIAIWSLVRLIKKDYYDPMQDES